MVHQFFIDKRVHEGLTFEQYMGKFKAEAEKEETADLSDEEKEDRKMTYLNYQRSTRILRTYNADNELVNLITNISSPMIWMVISEMWCGDSAQNLPYLAKMAEINPLIQLRIIMRDSNPDIMDLFLTNGDSRSIPKLVAFDEYGNELFQWGARPKEAQELVSKLKIEGMEKKNYLQQLHLWYGRDRGKTLEKEFSDILSSSDNTLLSAIFDYSQSRQ
ncbi:MAG: thioredoxin family protein [Ignavibacteriae bacterium HGW-Ignavibacteriae-3]|nr:MAG: thioredoxin family protein [Ignavibacteriae bacterium HGW-Ignavibacteriae-3]